MKEHLNAVSREIVTASLIVHRELGPGLLESAYEASLTHEIRARGLSVERQKPLPLIYRGHRLDCGYRLDLVVDDCIVVEIKTVERFEPVHLAQVISYLRLSGFKVGLLVNFHARLVARYGIRRVVHNFPD